MIRVLVVDDSAFVRLALKKILEGAPDIEVVGTARNGEEAVRLARELKPDIITMDIVMPVKDGISAIREIRSFMDVPIIVISDYTREGARETMQALSAGAVDFIPKGLSQGRFDLSFVAEEILKKVRIYAGGKVKPQRRVFTTEGLKEEPKVRSLPQKPQIVVVVSSTGGPKVIPTLLSLAGRLPIPLVIAQHMPKGFTLSFAEWLSKETHMHVVEGEDCLKLESELVVVIPGGYNGYVEKKATGFMLRISEEPQTIVKPSGDVLFKSVAEEADYAVGIILTGMGNDGTEGAKEFVKRGFPVLVQEPSTCVVCGMPCSAIEAKAYTHIMTVEQMGRWLKEACSGQMQGL